MSITIKHEPNPHKTEVEISSILSITQENCSGHNHIVLVYEEIKEIYNTFREYNKDWI